MNSKQRVHATLAGKPVDYPPATVLYNQLYFQDHFAELTGRPQWQMQGWLHANPDEYLATYRQMIEQIPFAILQPDSAPSRQARENTAVMEKDGQHYLHNRRTGEWRLLDTVSGHARDYTANEERKVFDLEDIRKIKVTKAEELIARGNNDFIEAAVAALGQEQFILSGGVIGTIFSTGIHLGQTTALMMLAENPPLIEALCHKITEQNIEIIRCLAAAGGDAIYIDDATATSDMISVRAYERFSLPYMKTMVDEIHRLGQKAIIIYFGGVADRLEQIAAVGADGLSIEATMKNFVNDIGQAARQIGDRMTLFGNIDPLAVLQDASDEALEAEMRRQAEAARPGRGFLHSTGSPITPNTPAGRVRLFLDLGKRIH